MAGSIAGRIADSITGRRNKEHKQEGKGKDSDADTPVQDWIRSLPEGPLEGGETGKRVGVRRVIDGLDSEHVKE